ncbi:sigma-54 interaction domain-containing protein [Novosphingobium terrae]|uniref:sigma-54 interaction domain-containing protein n=1 Tax=Novosphingobium terrae TaxID=2726189 RepID=UPI00197DE79E|nr:sigma 54-interacting transcriptional regulator [Novosphingobium terrae]
MDAIEFTTATAKAHAPLVQRAAAIIAAVGRAQPIWLADAGEAATMAPAGHHRILLDRSAQPAIAALPAPRGERHFALSYTDPVSDSSLAALIACATRPGAPIAADPESISILALAERLAASDIPVLIGGPTGTGKEVLSRFIHDRSPRAKGPFVAVNCAAMPEAMLEALLFGHTKGAFTGATQASEGFFRAADGGTLLLDEIAEMPLTLQAKLLRTLQEGEVVPIGSTQPIKIDVRIIAAANRDLPTEVAEGRFRADLFYRLNVFPLALRALRERLDDIAPLAFALALRHTPKTATAMPWISDGALAMLRMHGWPGNVRELENVVRRALLLADTGSKGGRIEIRPEHIHFDSPARLVAMPAAVAAPVTAPAAPESASVTPIEDVRQGRRLAGIVQASEAKAIMETLAACNGSRVAAARALGISERTLRYRLASFRDAGIPATAFAGGRR